MELHLFISAENLPHSIAIKIFEFILSREFLSLKHTEKSKFWRRYTHIFIWKSEKYKYLSVLVRIITLTKSHLFSPSNTCSTIIAHEGANFQIGFPRECEFACPNFSLQCFVLHTPKLHISCTSRAISYLVTQFAHLYPAGSGCKKSLPKITCVKKNYVLFCLCKFRCCFVKFGPKASLSRNRIAYLWPRNWLFNYIWRQKKKKAVSLFSFPLNSGVVCSL